MKKTLAMLAIAGIMTLATAFGVCAESAKTDLVIAVDADIDCYASAQIFLLQ